MEPERPWLALFEGLPPSGKIIATSASERLIEAYVDGYAREAERLADAEKGSRDHTHRLVHRLDAISVRNWWEAHQ